MRGLDGGDNALGAGQMQERIHGLGVRNRHVGGATRTRQPRVLRTDSRIVEAGGNRVRSLRLAVTFLQDERACSVEHAHLVGGDGGSVTPRLETIAGSLASEELDARVIDKSGE